MLALAAVLLALQASPAPSAKPEQCNSSALVTRTVEPEGWYGLSGTSVIKLAIAPDGTVSDAKIIGKSGNDALDVLTYQAAVQSKYKAKMVQCHPVASTLIFFAVYDGKRVRIRAAEEVPTASKVL
jgi:hypothetical protein